MEINAAIVEGLEIVIDEQIPTHAVYITVSNGRRGSTFPLESNSQP